MKITVAIIELLSSKNLFTGEFDGWFYEITSDALKISDSVNTYTYLITEDWDSYSKFKRVIGFSFFDEFLLRYSTPTI